MPFSFCAAPPSVYVMSTWNLTGFWNTAGPPVALYSARKLVWEMTLWLRLGICGRRRRERGLPLWSRPLQPWPQAPAAGALRLRQVDPDTGQKAGLEWWEGRGRARVWAACRGCAPPGSRPGSAGCRPAVLVGPSSLCVEGLRGDPPGGAWGCGRRAVLRPQANPPDLQSPLPHDEASGPSSEQLCVTPPHPRPQPGPAPGDPRLPHPRPCPGQGPGGRDLVA